MQMTAATEPNLITHLVWDPSKLKTDRNVRITGVLQPDWSQSGTPRATGTVGALFGSGKFVSGVHQGDGSHQPEALEAANRLARLLHGEIVTNIEHLRNHSSVNPLRDTGAPDGGFQLFIESKDDPSFEPIGVSGRIDEMPQAVRSVYELAQRFVALPSNT